MPRYGASEFERLLSFVRERRAEEAQDVAIGKPKCWDDYCRSMGRIRTLDEIETEMKRITGTPDGATEQEM